MMIKTSFILVIILALKSTLCLLRQYLHLQHSLNMQFNWYLGQHNHILLDVEILPNTTGSLRPTSSGVMMRPSDRNSLTRTWRRGMLTVSMTTDDTARKFAYRWRKVKTKNKVHVRLGRKKKQDTTWVIEKTWMETRVLSYTLNFDCLTLNNKYQQKLKYTLENAKMMFATFFHFFFEGELYLQPQIYLAM